MVAIAPTPFIIAANPVAFIEPPAFVARAPLAEAGVQRASEQRVFERPASQALLLR